MAVWLIRAGSHGEYELKFTQEGRVYVGTLGRPGREPREAYRPGRADEGDDAAVPGNEPKAIANWASQVWPFAHEVTKSDVVVLPLKTQRAIHIGEVTRDYHFETDGPNPFFH